MIEIPKIAKTEKKLLRLDEPGLILDASGFGFNGLSDLDLVLDKLKQSPVKITLKSISKQNEIKVFTLPRMGMLKTYANVLSNKGEQFIFYVSGLDSFMPEIKALRTQVASQDNWRQLASTMSISYPQTAAYQRPHLDPFDVLILQTSGIRKWKIWDQSLVDSATLKRIQQGDPKVTWDSAKHIPLYEINLMEGQALFIPAYYPHFAITSETSETISISFAISWRAFSIFSVISETLSPQIVKQLLELDEIFFLSRLHFPDNVQNGKSLMRNVQGYLLNYLDRIDINLRQEIILWKKNGKNNPWPHLQI